MSAAEDPLPGDPSLRPDVAACRRHWERAVAVIAEIMEATDSGAANRLRAALEIVERAWGRPDPVSGEADEPSLADYLSGLGPREPAPPEVLEERSKALHLFADQRR